MTNYQGYQSRWGRSITSFVQRTCYSCVINDQPGSGKRSPDNFGKRSEGGEGKVLVNLDLAAKLRRFVNKVEGTGKDLRRTN